MSFRLRITLLTAAAVAVAAIGASVAMYFLVQKQLVDQVDNTLARTAVLGAPAGPFRGPRLISGRQDVFAQIVDASGSIVEANLDVAIPALVTQEVKDVAAGRNPGFTATATSQEISVRVLVRPLGGGRALELAKSLEDIDAALGQTRIMLAQFAIGAILLAALLGLLVARTALAPVKRLTSTVEEVTRTRDLSRRVAAHGRDELSRLGTSFDAMLAQLERSLRSQRQLVADASHELRSPLTSLRTNLELLERGLPADPDERQQLMRDLVTQMERLTTLVGDLIEVARDEDVPMPFEELRLDEVVREVVDDMRFRYPKARFAVSSMPTTVRGVKVRVARAITNLLDNAAKWSPPGATVEVSVADGEVAVRDHGPGIAAEDAPRVFDRFWRASNAHHLPGSGLGLAIVKDVAESHGGSVVLERPSDGGARFRLKLGGV